MAALRAASDQIVDFAASGKAVPGKDPCSAELDLAAITPSAPMPAR
jgi:hypothetical protein